MGGYDGKLKLTLGIFYDFCGRCKSWIGHDINSASDEGRDCKGQADHLLQISEDITNFAFALEQEELTATSTASCSYLTPGYSD